MAPIQQDLYKGGQWTFDHYCFSMISAAATRWVLDQVKCVLQDVLVLYLLEGDYLRGEICQCRRCRRQCKIFASSVNVSIFTNFLVFLSPKLLKFGKNKGVKLLA